MKIKHPFYDLLALLALLLVLVGACLVFSPPTEQPKQQRPGVTPQQQQPPPRSYPKGYTPDRDSSERFIRSLPRPRLDQAGPELFRDDQQRDTLLYRALYRAYADASGGRQWVVGAQGIGDCVSWAWAHGADVHLAVMYLLGDSAEWHAAATEAIYGGSRVEAQGRSFAGWSDGSYGAAAAKWVRDWGVLFRQPYGEIDLTRYSARRAKQWGAYGCGGRGDGGQLDQLARSHPIKEVALVTTFDAAARAIQSGYPVVVCSGQGFTSTRDADGFCRARGRWSHAMCFIGVRYGQRPGLLCLNSWGPDWVSGPVWPADQPSGSFWVEARVATRMLSGRDSFAISGYRGFPHRKLDHGAWVRARPRPDHDRPQYALAP